MVPVVDLARRYARLGPELRPAIERVMASGWVLLGPELEAFETEFAAFTSHRHCVGVGSGTDALRLSLVALGIGPGDEVVVPGFTAVPTAAAVCAAGATPVFADVDPDTAAMDIEAARGAVTEHTKALIPVHLYGRPATLPALGLPVVEDAAQAHGALQPSGSAAVAYSFYPTKNLGGIGDGGAIVTDDSELADRLRRLRHHGQRQQYVHDEIATNSRLSEIEAAALRVGLRTLVADNQRRRLIAAAYREAAPGLRWQAPHEGHVYHLCVARVPERDAWRARMPFETAVHYPLALTQQPAYRQFARRPCPEAEAWAAECVTLPCFPEMTDEEVDAVCNGIR